LGHSHNGLDSSSPTVLWSTTVDTLIATVTAQRLGAREHGDEPGWLCRLCEFASCDRPQGECLAANAAQAIPTGAPPTT